MSSALVVLVVFGVQVGYGAPARHTQSARALSCCARRCHHHASSTASAARCCGVREVAGEVVTSAPPKLPDAGLIALGPLAAFDASTSREGCPGGRVETSPAARARGAPLFLLTHSLRI
jgi:hypothetical protein